MVKVIMYNDKVVYKAVIWVFWGVNLWKEQEDLNYTNKHKELYVLHCMA